MALAPPSNTTQYNADRSLGNDASFACKLARQSAMIASDVAPELSTTCGGVHQHSVMFPMDLVLSIAASVVCCMHTAR